MPMTPLKAFLSVVAVAVVGVTLAYVAGVFDRFIEAPSQTIAALPDGTPAPGQADETPKPDGSVGDAATSPTPAPAGDAAAPEVVPPSFDLVRVEPDGSVVIAGKAAPSSKIEVLTGSKVLGETSAGPEGDFAVVLDDMLEPGGYQIVLRSTTADGVVAMSPETAVVSIPDQPSGEVLALVEKPGEPSKLITVPEPGKPAGDAQASAQPESGQTGAQPAPAQTVAPAQAGNSAEQPATAADAAQPDAASGGGQVASAPPASPAGETAQPPAYAQPPAGKIRVEAVEIDGSQVFVAGVAQPGSTVRAYANDIFLGESRASPGGQFLVEALRNLPVGDYIIRADMVGEDGKKVIARATVPFQREPGESIAAVAPQTPPAPSSEAGAQPAAPSAPAATDNTPPATPSQASGTQSAAAQQSAGSASQGGGAATPAPQATEPAGQQQPAQTAAPSKKPAAGATPSSDAAADSAAATGAAPSEKPSSQPAGATDTASASGSPAEPPSEAGASLQPVDASVIIRRGDSLWRISRRVYGRGVRYSTIYLANQDQIADPDRIWPGQIFRVPEKTSEGESADMEAISERKASGTAEGQSATQTR